MQKIIVTGCAGFIGAKVSEILLKEGYQVVGIDSLNDYYDVTLKLWRLKNLKRENNFNFYSFSIENYDKLKLLFKKYCFGAVINLAARAGVRPSIQHPVLYEDVNVRGTLNLLELCREFKVMKFLFASSSSVYGNNKKIPFSESDNVDYPVSPYAATKKAGELLCFNYHHLYGLDISCLRFFTVYGPRQRPEMAVHNRTSSSLPL